MSQEDLKSEALMLKMTMKLECKDRNVGWQSWPLCIVWRTELSSREENCTTTKNS